MKKLTHYLTICDTLGLDALVETHDEEEIKMAVSAGAGVIGVNNRNLKDFSVDFSNAVKLRHLIPEEVIYVAESGVSRISDVEALRQAGADAVLMGEVMMRAKDQKAMLNAGFTVISRLRNDSVLFYPTTKERTGKRGRPFVYDGKIDFSNLDLSRCEQLDIDKGRLFSLKAYSKPLKKTIKLVVWYPDDGSAKWQLYFSTDADMLGKDVIDIYRTRFQIEFFFRSGKQHTGLTQCQSTSINKLAFNFNASLSSINLAKATCKKLNIPFSISTCKSVVHNTYMLERFICVSGLNPDPHLIDKLVKELVLFTARAA